MVVTVVTVVAVGEAAADRGDAAGMSGTERRTRE
jgi:hypothetical protein